MSVAAFEEGLESLIRTIQEASPKLKEAVFRNAVSEAATYAQSGFSRQIVVDRLNEAARSVGLRPNAEDLIDGYAVTGATTSECPLVPKPHDQNRLKPIRWSDLHRLPKRESSDRGFP